VKKYLCTVFTEGRKLLREIEKKPFLKNVKNFGKEDDKKYFLQEF
jgi:hypothetical protein